MKKEATESNRCQFCMYNKWGDTLCANHTHINPHAHIRTSMWSANTWHQCALSCHKILSMYARVCVCVACCWVNAGVKPTDRFNYLLHNSSRTNLHTISHQPFWANRLNWNTLMYAVLYWIKSQFVVCCVPHRQRQTVNFILPHIFSFVPVLIIQPEFVHFANTSHLFVVFDGIVRISPTNPKWRELKRAFRSNHSEINDSATTT